MLEYYINLNTGHLHFAAYKFLTKKNRFYFNSFSTKTIFVSTITETLI